MAEKVVNLSLVLLSKFDTSEQEGATKTATSHIRQPLQASRKKRQRLNDNEIFAA